MADALISLIIASFLLLGSPGPTPLALAAVGATFGFRAGIPFLLGILVGLAAVVSLGAAGMSAFFESYPAGKLFVQVCGGLYICYIAYKVATAPVLGNDKEVAATAPVFKDGVIFNLLNPKAYAVLLALYSQFALPIDPAWLSVVATGVLVYAIGVVIDILWLSLGGALRPVFAAPKPARAIRVFFALAMVGAVIYTFVKS
jgi:threonine/homoserine/homoserine lactone efflux protein